jgi:hypothetical protein
VNGALADRSGNAELVRLLALQAAAALGGKVTRLALYEAPYNDAEGAARDWRELRARIDGLLAADRRADAITSFLKFVGAPDDGTNKDEGVTRVAGDAPDGPDPCIRQCRTGRSSIGAHRHRGQGKGQCARDGRWGELGNHAVHAPTEQKLAKSIPHARHLILEGQAHDVSPEVLAPVLLDFFAAASRSSGRLR